MKTKPEKVYQLVDAACCWQIRRGLNYEYL